MARLVREGKIDSVQYERLKNEYKEKIRLKNEKIRAEQEIKVKTEEFDSLMSTPKSDKMSESGTSKRSGASLSETQDKS